jgi:hypothetical protein
MIPDPKLLTLAGCTSIEDVVYRLKDAMHKREFNQASGSADPEIRRAYYDTLGDALLYIRHMPPKPTVQ